MQNCCILYCVITNVAPVNAFQGWFYFIFLYFIYLFLKNTLISLLTNYVIDYASWYCIYTIKKYMFSSPINIHNTKEIKFFSQKLSSPTDQVTCKAALSVQSALWILIMNCIHPQQKTLLAKQFSSLFFFFSDHKNGQHFIVPQMADR